MAQPTTIQIDIPEEVSTALEQHIQQLTKPPRFEPDTGNTIIEPMFRSISEYVAAILKVNFARVLADQPTPQIQQLRTEIEERQRQIEELAQPTVAMTTVITDPGLPT